MHLPMRRKKSRLWLPHSAAPFVKRLAGRPDGASRSLAGRGDTLLTKGLTMIKQCVAPDCGRSFDSGRERGPGAKTCSDECSAKVLAKYYKDWHEDDRKNNHQRYRDRQNDWARRNPDKIREYRNRYVEKNRDKVNAQVRARTAKMGGKRRHTRHWKVLRLMDGDNCVWCGKAIDFSVRANFHVDHWRPVAHGGTSDIGNLCLMHAHCNERKGDQWPLPPLVRDRHHPQLDLFDAALA